ncbi:SIMPL domain-containing protein [Paracoccus sp. MBLB3053]|uniref:SIMPL domain-containing protein n=1 Tax=Paracoccus aurantius TaxID=3073814 RepID=A0ABU2HR64_9RHOB|nr:SIMPL domain-containing protein [Paracoccus sp. MBLB3053]MDS9467549.1 SIMPL domain-containing protein [Paracoccus sp. MBLB3053]
MSHLRPFLAAASLAILAGGAAVAQSPAPGDTPPPARMGHHGKGHHAAMLTVTGQGSSSAQPDMARITLGVSTEAETAAEAMTQNSTQQQAVLEALKAEGIEDRDIQTAGLNLSPRMEYNNGQPPKMVGYVAQNTVHVRVRDLAGLGGILDKLVSTGANEISGISFGREDMAEAQDKARAEAVADARHRAELMAQAAGMKLGNLRALSDSPIAEGPRPMMAMRAEAKGDSPVPIAAGELEVTAQVTAIFELLPANAPDDVPEEPAPVPAPQN